jgi:hypothetical protein
MIEDEDEEDEEEEEDEDGEERGGKQQQQRPRPAKDLSYLRTIPPPLRDHLVSRSTPRASWSPTARTPPSCTCFTGCGSVGNGRISVLRKWLVVHPNLQHRTRRTLEVLFVFFLYCSVCVDDGSIAKDHQFKLQSCRRPRVQCNIAGR